MIPDHSRFSNDHARAMINAKMFSNPGRRMNINTCFAVCVFSNDAGNSLYSQRMQLMGDAVCSYSVKPGIRLYYLALAFCRRIALIHRNNIPVQLVKYFGEKVKEMPSDRPNLHLAFVRIKSDNPVKLF